MLTACALSWATEARARSREGRVHTAELRGLPGPDAPTVPASCGIREPGNRLGDP